MGIKVNMSGYPKEIEIKLLQTAFDNGYVWGPNMDKEIGFVEDDCVYYYFKIIDRKRVFYDSSNSVTYDKFKQIGDKLVTFIDALDFLKGKLNYCNNCGELLTSRNTNSIVDIICMQCKGKGL